MRDNVVALTALLAIAAWCGPASAQTAPPAGALACSGCHAGRDNAMPNLDGMSAADIAGAMTAFRSGSRDATVMDRIARGFTDQETSAIAAWLAQSGGAK